MKLYLAIACVLACGAACGGQETPFDQASAAVSGSFTEQDVNDIVRLLGELEGDEYRVQLPVFRGGAIVGQSSYGDMPMTEVRRIASMQGVRLDENANILAVFESCNGGGAGSHTDSTSAATGIADRINEILRSINSSEYQYLH